jgi:hypothetical protein
LEKGNYFTVWIAITDLWYFVMLKSSSDIQSTNRSYDSGSLIIVFGIKAGMNTVDEVLSEKPECVSEKNTGRANGLAFPSHRHDF